MTHSYRSHYFHIVWATKDRKDLITFDIRDSLYAYMGGIVKAHHSYLLGIGGTTNHVHLLIASQIRVKFSDFIKEIKANSSLWIHKNFPQHYNFAWQEGYGSFTVSHSGVDQVKHYINNQEEHHKVFSFEEEYLKLLEKHNIKFDHRFVMG